MGDILDVVRIDEPVRGVVAQTLEGEIVGTITQSIALLRRCLGEGVLYEAEITRITGGSVSVTVRQR